MGAPTTTTAPADAVAINEEKKTKKSVQPRFALYQMETGSYQFGVTKCLPGVILEMPGVIELPDEDPPVVRVFETRELAQKNLEKLQTQFKAQKGKV